MDSGSSEDSAAGRRKRAKGKSPLKQKKPVVKKKAVPESAEEVFLRSDAVVRIFQVRGV